MISSNIKEQILSVIKDKPILKDIDLNDDIFDSGVSSLTVIDTQLQIEKKTGIEVPTEKLMALNTIAEWLECYKEYAEK